jgi:adenylate cyclase
VSDEQIAAARQHINEQIADPLDFDDNIALARLDVRLEALQEERQRYEAMLGKLLAAAVADDKVLTTELLAELDDWRDDFDRKIDAARSEMRRLAGAAIVGTRAYQRHVVQIGLALLAIAALLGIIVAAAVPSAWCVRCVVCWLGPLRLRVAPSTPWCRLPRATRLAG